MTDVREIAGVFRDRDQAKLAAAAARRQGLEVPAPEDLVEDAAGVHVILGTTGVPEDARQLLLECGAYSASMSYPNQEPLHEEPSAPRAAALAQCFVRGCRDGGRWSYGGSVRWHRNDYRDQCPDADTQCGRNVIHTSVDLPTKHPASASRANCNEHSPGRGRPRCDPNLQLPGQHGAGREWSAAPAPMGATPDRPFGPRTKDIGCAAYGALPDTACTPGAVFPQVTAEQVRQRGYSSSVRNVPAEVSREVYREYGIVERTTGVYEVDHHVPLEAGGSNDIANLWPEAAEPRPGFHEKDQVENYLHDQVCAGTMSLLDAQRAISTNWWDVYRQQSQRALATVAPPLAPAPQPAPASNVQITSVAGSGPGGRATVVAQTTPGASCSIAYRTPAGTSSTAQGLGSKIADASGTASWTWEIGPSTRPGTGTVVVTAGGYCTQPGFCLPSLRASVAQLMHRIRPSVIKSNRP
jgi:hypothetical protein